MKRQPSRLVERVYDLIVVGGGIHGVWTAWDAALRGLSVAILEKGDFGGATSANTLRVAHGGLRYLQHADIRRMRQSAHEQRVLMRLAPHLVRPLPFLLPTRGWGLESKLLLSLALRLNELICSDQKAPKDSAENLPPGRTLTKEECLRLCPWLESRELTGGALWHDAQLSNPDRLLLSVLRSAVEKGADAVNYFRVERFLRDGDRVAGVGGRDTLSGEDIQVRGRLVVNATGPWVDQTLGLLGRQLPRLTHLSKAMNLVMRPLVRDVAVGVTSQTLSRDRDAVIRRRSRVYFLIPWNAVSLVGTAHLPFEGEPDGCRTHEAEIREFLGEIQRACPALGLQPDDVLHVHVGALPAREATPENEGVQLLKQHRIHDHLPGEGIDGLVSLVGIKYTTGRAVAEQAVDLLFRKLGHVPPPSRTSTTPIHGRMSDGERVSGGAPPASEGLSARTLDHLTRNYGAAYSEILRCVSSDSASLQPLSPLSPVLRAEILYAVRHEMAEKLADVVFRRTVLGTCGDPGVECLAAAATLMASELGWDDYRKAKELEEVRRSFLPTLKEGVAPVPL